MKVGRYFVYQPQNEIYILPALPEEDLVADSETPERFLFLLILNNSEITISKWSSVPKEDFNTYDLW